MLSISINGLEQSANYLQRLKLRAGNLRPAMLEIGEVLTESTKQRFETGTAPDGSVWASNSNTTLLYKAGDKPLVNYGYLAESIHYQSLGNTGVAIGTNKVQAAMMQFGGTKAQFPHLWGDIPARPYLGLSADDGQDILEILAEYLL